MSQTRYRPDGSPIIGVSAGQPHTISFVVDGGGLTIPTGELADVYISYAGTITAVTLLADQVGSVVVDIWKRARSSYPPTVAQSIVAAAFPTLSGASNSQDTTLAGWTTTFASDDTLRFKIVSASTITRLHLALTVVDS